MTMYARASAPISINVSSDKGGIDFFLDQTPKVLPLWVAQSVGFQKLWNGGKVQVATDSNFSQTISSVPVSETGAIPSTVFAYQGVWNAATNTPSLTDGVGRIGDLYRVSVAGSHNFGSGAISFEVGDYVILNSSSLWEKSDTADAVTSVAGLKGDVVTADLKTALSIPSGDLVSKDAYGIIHSAVFPQGVATTTTTNGTTALAAGSASVQIFTGTSSNHTVVLPKTGVVAGQTFKIVNLCSSGGTVATNAFNGSNIIATQLNSQVFLFTAKVDAPNAPSDWFYQLELSNLSLASAAIYGPGFNAVYTTTFSILNGAGNQPCFKVSGSGGANANYLNPTGATAGNTPVLLATGTDDNVDGNLTNKGNATWKLNGKNIVDVSSPQALSGKTWTEVVYTIVDGAGFSITPSNGSIQTITLGTARTPVGSFSAGQSVTLMISNAGGYAITWTDATLNPTWVGGSAPVLSTTQQTIIVLWKVGSVIYGCLVGYA